MSITTGQITIIQTIIAANKLQAHKEAIIQGASYGRTTSTKELLFAEASQLIAELQKKYPRKAVAVVDHCHRMRGKILSICHTLGWYKIDDSCKLIVDSKTQKRLLDYERINAFCLKAGKKRLDKFDLKELQKMIYIFEKVERDYLTKI